MSNLLPIWPVSPVPAPMAREVDWGENVNMFDSGARQAGSPYDKPFIRYSWQFANWPYSKQQLFWVHYHACRGTVSPFLFMDPYDYQTGRQVVVNTGSGVTSFMVVNSLGWRVIAASGALVITSVLSGALTSGTHFVLDQDTGIIVASMAPAAGDYWTASANYFKKCAFDKAYSESSQLWQMFGGAMSFKETV